MGTGNDGTTDTLKPDKSCLVECETLSGLDMWKSHLSNDPIIKYVNDHSIRLEAAQTKLMNDTISMYPQLSRMMGSADELQLLCNMIRHNVQFSKVIDIGVFTGYSSLSFAIALKYSPPQGRCGYPKQNPKVYALDITSEFMDKINSIKYWKEAEVDDIIEFREGKAIETLSTFEHNSIDFIFIDADKLSYVDYYEKSIQLLRPGGIVAIDNTLWRGQVVTSNISSNISRNEYDVVEAILNFNTHVKNDSRVDVSFLTIGDGTTICWKK